MKKSGILALFFIVLISLYSQNQWNEQGIPIRQGVNIEWARAAQVVEDGSIIYVWSDTRNGDRDVWAQKVSETGELLWGEQSSDGNWKDGIMINGEINRQEDIVIIGVGNNEVIVAWVDFRHEDFGDIYAQKIGADGSLLWDSSGVPLCLVPGIQISLNIVNNDDGGAYIIWQDSRGSGGTDIYGTHILSNGSIAAGWAENGSPIASANNAQNQHTFWEDGVGGAIMVWKDERDSSNPNLYAQRLSANNPSVWQENGILISNAPNEQTRPNIRPDGTGNFIISWRDKRNENNGDIYAQRIDIDGNILWQQDLAVCNVVGIQENPRLTYLHGEGCVIVWEDGRNDPLYMDLYAQKILPNGSLAWNAGGVPIVIASNHQRNPRLDPAENGGVWIIWDDGRLSGHPHEDIYIQKLNSDGTIQFEENGRLLSDAPRQQYNPLIKANSNGYAFALWGDLRTGSTGMHLQILDDNGNEMLAEEKIVFYGLDGDGLQFKVLENGSQPFILWADTRNSSFGSQIYIQSINQYGQVLFPKNGKSITDMTGFNQNLLQAVIAPNNDIIVATWQEIRDEHTQIYAQAVDFAGNFLWNPMGINLGSYPQEQQFPHLSHVSENNESHVYMGWSDRRQGMDFAIFGQKVAEDGTLLWGEEGIPVANTPYDDVLQAIVENYYIWISNEFWNIRIFVMKLEDDGSPAAGWPENGLMICPVETTGQYAQNYVEAKVVPEGLLLVWEDKRDGKNDIYTQLISASGELLWEEDGVAVNTEANDKIVGNVLVDEEIYVLWEDYRTGIYNDIYMQKVGDDGSLIWAEAGLAVDLEPADKTQPYMSRNGNQLVAFWREISAESESDLFVQAVSASGELLWQDGSRVVCSAIKNQNKPQATSDAAGNTFVFWEDTRSSGKTDIYNIAAQMIRIDGTSVAETVISPYAIRAHNYPNPFNPETTIRFEKPLSAPEESTISIFNLKGQLVKTLTAKSSQVTWNGMDKENKPTATGVYFYQVQSGEYQSAVEKMILLK